MKPGSRSRAGDRVRLALAVLLALAAPACRQSPSPPTGDRTLVEAGATLHYPSSLFGLASASQPAGPPSVVSACQTPYDDCLYYQAAGYRGTNFESAGIGLRQRPDLTTAAACLNTPPDGYSGLTPAIRQESAYATAAFLNLNEGAAGHLSSGSLFRVAYAGTCLELALRIAQTQFDDYPAGTIVQFTPAQESALQAQMLAVVATLTLPHAVAVRLPPSP